MNNFTKEELEYLKLAIYERPDTVTEKMDTMRNKLQSMIENYCEHNDTCQHEWGVGFGSIHSPVTYCKKCYCQKPSLPTDIFDKAMGINK